MFRNICFCRIFVEKSVHLETLLSSIFTRQVSYSLYDKCSMEIILEYLIESPFIE